MRRILIVACLALFVEPAQSETFGEWQTGFGQGVSEYSTENSNGDKLMIDCGEPPYGPSVDLRISSGTRDFNDGNKNSFIKFRVGNREGSLNYDKEGRLNTSFWQALRSGDVIEFQAPDGRRVQFSLRGSKKALPRKQCISQVELEFFSIKQTKDKLADSNIKSDVGTPDAAERTSGSCEIEDWKYENKAGSIYLNGTTTCPKGKLIYRLYDGQTGEFIASDETYIRGYSFQSYTDGLVPQGMKLKYVIEEK
jgi:hypothetical protein